MTIDFHAHLVAPEVYAETSASSIFAQTQNANRAASVIARMADLDDRIEAMDRMKVEVQVLSSSLVHQCTYDMDERAGLRVDQMMNDRIAEAVRRHLGRLKGLGSLPLQNPELAAGELQRCIEQLGLNGVTISTSVNGVEIGDSTLRPFWAAAEALDAVVFIHPAGNHDTRFRKFQLWNSIGQSFEEAMAIASLMYEGILDAYPGLKIVVSHGGGYMPYYLGRIARNYAEKPETRAHMSKPPIDYLRMLHYDTCVYDADTLRQLVSIVGAERVVLGTDYPVGEPKPIEFVEGCDGLNPQQCQSILKGNARRLLKI